MRSRDNSQSGQIGLVVLLIMTALLSVGISAVNKSTQDLRITREEVESSQAFNAAEEGMEEALKKLDDHFSGDTLITGEQTLPLDEGIANVSYQIDTGVDFRMAVNNNSVVRLDIPDNTVTDWAFEWGLEADACANPSLVIVAYDTVSYTARRLAYQPRGCSSVSGFDEAASSGTAPLNSRQVVQFTTNETIVRVRVIGGDTVLAANQMSPAGASLTQHYVLKSRAESTEGDQVKVIEVRRSLPALPFVFDYALFSGTKIEKN